MMHHKNILFVSRTTRFLDKMREIKQALDVSILPASPDNFTHAISTGHNFDLIVLDIEELDAQTLAAVDAYIADNANISILSILDRRNLAALRRQSQNRSDFVIIGASDAEFQLRVALLLWPGEESSSQDIVHIDNMVINLATYQVYIDDKPVDLTLMEYSLLSFLATHPGRAYSRETLLHRVWGFEYCGGTRTVDVHIRRVRSKVGPQVASHVVTVRGVGYLFKI